MYQRDIPRLPIKIDREEFVDIVFDIGLRHSHGYDTIVASVMLGDKFVSYTGHRTPFIDLNNYKIQQANNKSDEKHQILKRSEPSRLADSKNPYRSQFKKYFMDELVPQIYSVELAHVVTVLVAKFKEDNGYKYTDDAVANTQNRYVIKMEWEIAMMCDFNIQINSFITLIGDLIWKLLEPQDRKINKYAEAPNEDSNKIQITDINSWHLSLVFWYLCKEICMNLTLINLDPSAVVMGVILLLKMGKLRAVRIYKERVFLEIMKKVAREYEVDLSELIRAYIAFKREDHVVVEHRLDTQIEEVPVQIPANIIKYMCEF